MAKQNAFLTAHADKLRREYQGQLACAIELNLIAHILSNHKALGVGPGRADRDLQAFREAQMEVADLINEDGKADQDLEYAKRKLADRLKAILGPENWAKYKQNFPLLRTYWED